MELFLFGSLKANSTDFGEWINWRNSWNYPPSVIREIAMDLIIDWLCLKSEWLGLNGLNTNLNTNTAQNSTVWTHRSFGWVIARRSCPARDWRGERRQWRGRSRGRSVCWEFRPRNLFAPTRPNQTINRYNGYFTPFALRPLSIIISLSIPHFLIKIEFSFLFFFLFDTKQRFSIFLQIHSTTPSVSTLQIFFYFLLCFIIIYSSSV